MRFRKEEIKKHRQKLYFYGFFDSILRSSSKYLIAISISIYFSRWTAHWINKSIKITACSPSSWLNQDYQKRSLLFIDIRSLYPEFNGALEIAWVGPDGHVYWSGQRQWLYVMANFSKYLAFTVIRMKVTLSPRSLLQFDVNKLKHKWPIYR